MTKVSKRVHMIALGCSKNLVDAECMITMIRENGYELTDDISLADTVVINTCGFIESAKKEAIDAILYAADYKKPEGNVDYIIVTGCLAQRYSKDILESMPEVDAVLGTKHYVDIVNTINSLYGSDSKCVENVDGVGGLDHMLSTRDITTTGYAWLKIGEGCINRCSYCAIPIIRGTFVSRPMEDILDEARGIVSRGFKELIVAAQDTTNYGIDIYGGRKLSELLNRLSEIDGLDTIRVMYGYMDGIDDELISTFKTNPKIAHYFDIPIQYGEDSILKAMNRRDTEAKITSVLEKLRREIPDIIIRTTVMVGFPGETEETFDRLITNLKKWKFDRLGCFTFSPEEGTAAFDMPNQIDEQTKIDRMEIVYEVQRSISEELNRKRLNSEVKVTIESISDDGIFYKGRSYGEAPEVDPEIFVASLHGELEIGKTYLVRLVDSSDYEITGVTV